MTPDILERNHRVVERRWIEALGDHVDLSLSVSVTKRELPEFLIPKDDPEAIGRAEYAQSLSMNGFVSVRLHWDATNGVRNNRFTRL